MTKDLTELSKHCKESQPRILRTSFPQTSWHRPLMTSGNGFHPRPTGSGDPRLCPTSTWNGSCATATPCRKMATGEKKQQKIEGKLVNLENFSESLFYCQIMKLLHQIIKLLESFSLLFTLDMSKSGCSAVQRSESTLMKREVWDCEQN